MNFGKGFTKSNLYQFTLFYKEFPSIFHTVSGNSSVLLSWSHYRTLLQVDDDAARNWYLKEAAEQTWSVRTLQRNISSQYYYRLFATKYSTYLPTKEQLRREIETQKQLFFLQQEEEKKLTCIFHTQ